MRYRLACTAAATAATAAVLAGPAFAASVNHPPGSTTISFLAGPGEANRLAVERSDATYVFTDPGATLTTPGGSDCTVTPPSTVTCPAAGVTFIQVDLGDMGDEATLGATPETLVFGRADADLLSGGSGPDELVGGAGRDTLRGNAGDDELLDLDLQTAADLEPSTMDGGPGADLVTGGVGPDQLTGGAGGDSVAGGAGGDQVAGGDDDDLVSGGDGNDVLLGEGGNDILGTDERLGADATPSEQGNDVLDGGPGNDELRPGLGASPAGADDDQLTGGPGSDLVTYSRRAASVAVSLDTGANDGFPGELDNVGADVERILGGVADDVLTGSPAGDVMDGGPGSDIIDGGPGNDSLQGDAGADALAGGGDTDTAQGGAGNDDITGGAGTDTLDGGDGDDAVDGAAPGLFAEDGRDQVAGGEGRDALSGGAGPDELVGGQGVDDMAGEEGTDTVDYGVAGANVTVTLDGRANDGARGEFDNVNADVENVEAGGLQDTVTGSGAANLLDSSSGQDYLDGAGGVDDLRAGRGIDVVRARDNGLVDVVDCGTGGGADFAILDRGDRARNCESFDSGRSRPVGGRKVVIRSARGSNGFGPPGMDRTVPLQDRLSVPVGSTVDATDGRVAVTSTRGRRGRQNATFYGATFTVGQQRGRKPVTELRLTGGSFARCRGAARASQHGARAAARKKVRGLWGSGRGKYRTRGRWSSAAARGTIWLVQDRCDGTLTRVRRGVVVVRDFVRNRTVRVRAGESYLARRPR